MTIHYWKHHFTTKSYRFLLLRLPFLWIPWNSPNQTPKENQLPTPAQGSHTQMGQMIKHCCIKCYINMQVHIKHHSNCRHIKHISNWHTNSSLIPWHNVHTLHKWKSVINYQEYSRFYHTKLGTAFLNSATY